MEEKKFKVLHSPSAQRDLEKMDPAAALQVAGDVLAYLSTFPLPYGKPRIKKLSGFLPPLYRLRSGDYRAYYRIDSGTVVVLAVTDKKDSEKVLKKIR